MVAGATVGAGGGITELGGTDPELLEGPEPPEPPPPEPPPPEAIGIIGALEGPVEPVTPLLVAIGPAVVEEIDILYVFETYSNLFKLLSLVWSYTQKLINLLCSTILKGKDLVGS